MSKTVSENRMGFLREVNRLLPERAGLEFTDLGTDMVEFYKRETATDLPQPSLFVEKAMTVFNLASKNEFATSAEAKAANIRRSALANFCRETPGWRPGSGRHGDAVFKEVDGVVARISISPSDDGQAIGFAFATSDDALLIPSSSNGEARFDVSPELPEFTHQGSGFDIKDAVEAYNSRLDFGPSSAPRV